MYRNINLSVKQAVYRPSLIKWTGLYRDSVVALLGIGENIANKKIEVRKSIFTLNLKNGKSQQLSRNSKIHGELVIVNCSFSKKTKTLHLYIRGPNEN